MKRRIELPLQRINGHVEMSPIIFDIPHTVCVSILADFSSVNDLDRLDSAFCTHEDRERFLTLLRSDELTSVLDAVTINNINGCVQWSVSRHVHFRDVRLTRKQLIPNELLSAFIQQSQLQIETVHDMFNSHSNVVHVMQAIDGTYPRLQYLEVSGTQEADYIVRLLQKAPNWRSFSFVSFLARSGYFIGAHCPHVTSIALHGEFTEQSLLGFMACFPNVRSFECGASCVPAAIWVSIVVSYRFLSKLTLNIPPHDAISDSYMTMMARACPCLTHITLENWSTPLTACVTALCEHCHQLESLSLTYSADFECAVLDAIAAKLGNQLKLLNISGCELAPGFWDFTALQSFAVLESLDIRHLWGAAYGTTFPTRNREDLAASLAVLFTSLTQLRTLKMDGLELSDAILCAIAQHCPHLECISIAHHAQGYTQAGILALAQHLYKLTTLTMADRASVLTDLAITLMKLQFPRLCIVTVDAEDDNW